MTGARGEFGVGASVTTAALDLDPHPLLRLLREREPVSFVPALGGWLVTRRDIALRVLRDAATFTVDDPRFTTARVVGPSMLSLDGAEHRRHRDPFTAALRAAESSGRLAAFTEAAAARLVTALAPAGHAELRRGLGGPLAVAVVAEVLGLGDTAPELILSWYDAIVGAVSGLAGRSAGGPGSRGPGSRGPGSRGPGSRPGRSRTGSRAAPRRSARCGPALRR